MDDAPQYWALFAAAALFGLTVATLLSFKRQAAMEKSRADERSRRAVAAARRAAAGLSPDSVPLRWVRAQMRLAMLLTDAGGRSYDRASFAEALQILDGTIPVLKTRRMTPELATALYYRGRAEWGLAGLEPGGELLEAAASTFRELLEVEPWPRHLLRGVVISLPAIILVDIGDRRDRPEIMREGIELARQALASARRRVRIDRAITRRNLCHALAVTARRTGDAAMLEEAVKVGNEACKLVERSRHPGQWSACKASLGHALGALGELQGDGALLCEAVAALEAAVSATGMELPREGRSTLLQTLGGVRLSLARLEHDPKLLAQSIEELRNALAAFDEAGLPHARAETAKMLGDALAEAGSRTEAETLYRSALECFQRGQAARHSRETSVALAGLDGGAGEPPPTSHMPGYQVN